MSLRDVIVSVATYTCTRTTSIYLLVKSNYRNFLIIFMFYNTTRMDCRDRTQKYFNLNAAHVYNMYTPRLKYRRVRYTAEKRDVKIKNAIYKWIENRKYRQLQRIIHVGIFVFQFASYIILNLRSAILFYYYCIRVFGTELSAARASYNVITS